MHHVLTSVAPLHMLGGLVRFGGEVQLTATRVDNAGSSAALVKVYTSPEFEIPLDSTYLLCTLVRESMDSSGVESVVVRRTTFNARTIDVPHLIDLPSSEEDGRLRMYIEMKVHGVPMGMVRGPSLAFCV